MTFFLQKYPTSCPGTFAKIWEMYRTTSRQVTFTLRHDRRVTFAIGTTADLSRLPFRAILDYLLRLTFAKAANIYVYDTRYFIYIGLLKKRLTLNDTVDSTCTKSFAKQANIKAAHYSRRGFF